MKVQLLFNHEKVKSMFGRVGAGLWLHHYCRASSDAGPRPAPRNSLINIATAADCANVRITMKIVKFAIFLQIRSVQQ